MGTPAEVYAQPANLHVAHLTGIARLLDAPIRAIGSDSIVVTVGAVSTTVPCANASSDSDGSATLLVRPEWAALGGDLSGQVIAVRYHGPDSDHYLETPVGTVIIRTLGTPRASEGERTTWSLLRCWRL